MTMMPTPLLDLTHLLAAQAIQQDAFEAGYSTVDEMMNRPVLETNALVLAWKNGFLEKRICRLSVASFRRYFKRLCLVAGMESPPRPYFLRIGAGTNFEGKFLRRLLILFPKTTRGLTVHVRCWNTNLVKVPDTESY